MFSLRFSAENIALFVIFFVDIGLPCKELGLHHTFKVMLRKFENESRDDGMPV